MGILNIFNKKQDKGFDSKVIHIVIKRLISGVTPQTVAEFNATQTRDNNFNLTVVNEDENFKEDIEFAKNETIFHLKYRLDLEKYDLKEKIEVINESIKKQQERVRKIKDGKIDDLVVNVFDEKSKLRKLKVLKYVVENESKGSYEELNSKGQRQITFLLNNGVFVPYFHKAPVDEKGENIDLHPDIGSKRKIFKEKDQELEKRMLEAQLGFLGTNLGKILTIAFIILFIGNMMGYWENMQRSQQITKTLDDSFWNNVEETAHGSAIWCSNYFVESMRDDSFLYNKWKLSLLNKTDPDNKKEVDQINRLIDLTDKFIGGK